VDEWIDILDGSGAKTGRVALKSEAHRKGLWHRCFHCWVIFEDGSGEAYLLAQRRALDKDTWPGWLDVSVAGHLGAGESALDGRREIEEEIGLSVPPERLVPLGTRRVEHEISQGRDREFHDVFLLFDGTPPGSLRLQEEEVDALVRIRLEDAAAMADGETVAATEYAAGGDASDTEVSETQVSETEVSDTEVSISDFVLGSGGYVRSVAEAAKAIRAGGKVGRIFTP
jgi:isopentenyldiphosphate isomerase